MNNNKNHWHQCVLIFIFVTISYLICQCSWALIRRMTTQMPKPLPTQENVNIEICFSDTTSQKIYDGITKIQKVLEEMKNDSVVITVNKFRK